MSHESPRDNHELADAYQVLNNSLSDEKLLALADGEGPLQVSELDADLRSSEAFHAFVAEFGWPNTIEDGNIVPTPHMNDVTFYRALTGGIEIDERDYYLNNFKVWMSVEPSSAAYTGGSVTDVYAAKPALHRAYVVAPEFMLALRIAYTSLPKLASFPDAQTLASSEGELVVKSAHIAYRLIERLLKATDPDLERRILFNTHSDIRITDAAIALSE